MKTVNRLSGLIPVVVTAVLGCSGGGTTVLAVGDSVQTAPVSDSLPLSVFTSRESTRTTTNTPPPTAAPRSWTLLAGGDVLMDRSEAAGLDPFVGMVPALASADLALVNVEMAITTRGTPARKPFVFRAPTSAAATIASAGVDVVSLANNHARDYGKIGLLDTVAALDEVGVISVGAGATAADAYAHRIVEIPGGPRVAFIGVTQVVPTGFSATHRRAGVAGASGQRERVLAHVRMAAEDADVVVVSVHWGIERDSCPSVTQRALARHLLGAGATAVIGHHPHVLQPVVTTEGQLVAYSLGNFVWRTRAGTAGETGILQLDFEDDRLTGWQFHPHRINRDGAPVPLSGGTRHQRIVDVISGRCTKHGA